MAGSFSSNRDHVFIFSFYYTCLFCGSDLTLESKIPLELQV